MEDLHSEKDSCSINILVVEDDSDYFSLISDFLTESELFPFNITWATTLKNAFTCLEKHDIDLILLDLNLPDSRGFHTFYKIHQVATYLPIIPLTGLHDKSLAIKSIKSGAQDYLLKEEITPSSLERSIHYAIERKHLGLEQKRLTKSLKKKQNDLERLNQDLENFAHVVAHDLKEPLRTVAGYVSFLDEDYGEKLNTEGKECIHFAVDGIKRMTALIDGLLEYSTLGEDDISFEDVKLEEIIEAVLKDLEVLINENKAEVNFQLDRSVIKGNPVRLHQLFLNLIGNAIKFKKPNESPRIDIFSTQNKNDYVFTVRDNGIGVSEKYKDKIFAIFQRLSNSSECPGTGIGLAVCKKIIDSVGGRIWVESELGIGSDFKFTIPANINER